MGLLVNNGLGQNLGSLGNLLDILRSGLLDNYGSLQGLLDNLSNGLLYVLVYLGLVLGCQKGGKRGWFGLGFSTTAKVVGLGWGLHWVLLDGGVVGFEGRETAHYR